MQRDDATATAGRKGLPYDWQQVIIEAAAERLDAELDSLLMAGAE